MPRVCPFHHSQRSLNGSVQVARTRRSSARDEPMRRVPGLDPTYSGAYEDFCVNVPAGPGAVSPRLRLAVASAQVCVIAALTWLWSTGSSDATATTVDWAFVGLALATPLVLGLSGWIGWRLHKRSGRTGPATIRSAAVLVQWTTLGLFTLALLTAPLAIFGAVVFGPMG